MSERLPEGVEAAVREAVEALSARFGQRLRGISLFGSFAWGEPTADSDVDLCIIVDGLTWAEHVEVVQLLAEITVRRLVDLSPIVYSAEVWRRYLATEHPLAERIERDGVAL